MNLELEGKVVLVTGSNRGTGLVIAKAFRAEGAQVIVHGLTPDLRSQEWTGDMLAVFGDITTDAGAATVAAQVTNRFPSIDVLINNYGAGKSGSWESATTDDWIEAYQVNTLSAVRMVQQFSPDMRARGSGRIINIGTIGSTRPNSRMPHYYASKAAMANLTVGLAKELSGTGITVNLVSPGMIRTPEVEASYMKRAQQEGWGDTFEAAEAKIASTLFPNPLNRIARREEVADVVVFLASARASYVNGQNLRVDGGALDHV